MNLKDVLDLKWITLKKCQTSDHNKFLSKSQRGPDLILTSRTKITV